MKKIHRILLTVFGVVAAIAVFLIAVVFVMYFHRSKPESIVKYDTTNPYIYENTALSAHRSGAGIMPEETYMAFQYCAENPDFKVDFFEFDLHITKDNVLVLLHDDTLDRVSDSEEVFGKSDVRPEEKSYEELRQLNMGAKFETEDGDTPYADFHGDSVPYELKILRLEDVLDYLMGQGDYHYIIEVKNDHELGKKSVDILYDVLKEKKLLDKVIFGSFHSEVSDYVDEAYPEMIRGAYGGEVLEFFISALLNKSDYHPDFEVLQLPFRNAKSSYGMNFGTALVVNYAHKNNLAVQYWTVNKEKDVEYLASIGADCIMTDYPDRMVDFISVEEDSHFYK